MEGQNFGKWGFPKIRGTYPVKEDIGVLQGYMRMSRVIGFRICQNPRYFFKGLHGFTGLYRASCVLFGVRLLRS